MFIPATILRQYIIVIIANFNLLHMGMSAAWMSPVLVKLRSVNETILTEPVTESEGAWVVSLSSLVCPFAILFTGYLGDNFGRKTAMVLGWVPRIIMALLFIFASELWMLLLARCFCGVADMIGISMTATYTSEIASKEIRGALGTFSQILSALGAMIMLSVGPFVSYLTINVILACIILTTCIPMLFLPESPYFLQSKGRIDDTLKVLISLRGTDIKAREEMKEYADKNHDNKMNFKDIWNDKVVLKTFGRIIVFAVASQLIGYNAVSVYLQTILIMTDTSVSPEISSLIIGCIELFACFCTVILTDRFGRKPILGTTLIGMSIGMLGLGTFFSVSEKINEIVGFLNYLPLCSIILAVYCYNAGIGSLMWIQIAELLDGKFRAFGVSIGVCITSFCVFLMLRFFPVITTSIGPASTYWIFSTCCILFCVFIVFCLPETKGKSFYEIQIALGRKINESVQ